MKRALSVVALVITLGAWVWIGVTNDQYSQLDRRLDSVSSLGDISTLLRSVPSRALKTSHAGVFAGTSPRSTARLIIRRPISTCSRTMAVRRFPKTSGWRFASIAARIAVSPAVPMFASRMW